MNRIMLPYHTLPQIDKKHVEVAGCALFINSNELASEIRERINKLKKKRLIVVMTPARLKKYYSISKTDFRRSKKIYYFAYGSNMYFKQMKERVKSAKFYSRAYLKDYSIAFNITGTIFNGNVANIIPSIGKTVWGVLYSVNQKEFHYKMDFYEGVKQLEYSRELITVTLENGEQVRGETYLNKNQLSKNGNPGKTYMKQIISAAIDQNLPTKYINYLSKFKGK